MKNLFKFLVVSCVMTSAAFANFFVVTAEQVTVSHAGMFVTVEGIAIPVQSLNASNDGYIVAIPQPMAAICPRCRRDTYTPGRTCSYCGFPITKKAE